jgi:hypothetical protein
MIHGVLSNNVIPSFGYAIAASGRQGRMSLPVSPQAYIYSHFEHVSGVPAPEGSRGVAISKLKLLDVLIDQLSQIKKQGNLSLGAEVSEERIDAMIENYKTQIARARAASQAMPYLPSPPAPAGAVFSLIV